MLGKFADANGLVTGKRKQERVLKIMLFGSYAAAAGSTSRIRGVRRTER